MYKIIHNLASRSKKGFTLIEMLIVIAIIGILASIVLVGLGPVQRRGRDARRQADLRSVQNALELYYNKCGYYPGDAAAAPGDCDGHTQLTDWDDLEAALAGSDIGVPRIPSDPSGGQEYEYATDSTGRSYVLAATLEDENNPAFRESPDESVNNIACGAPVYCIEH